MDVGCINPYQSTPMSRYDATRAQQLERIARISVVTGADAPETDGNMPAFLQALQQLGWAEGHNLRVDIRRGDGDAVRINSHAVETAAFAPDVILASGTASMAPLLQATRVVPIVFVNVADPVGAGFVNSRSALEPTWGADRHPTRILLWFAN